MMNTMFLGLGMNELLVIALVVLLFFGGAKIPELMKGMGKGVKAFKEGMNEPLIEERKEHKSESEESETKEEEK